MGSDERCQRFSNDALLGGASFARRRGASRRAAKKPWGVADADRGCSSPTPPLALRARGERGCSLLLRRRPRASVVVVQRVGSGDFVLRTRDGCGRCAAHAAHQA
eukprot:7326377-Prymnesium_polylepis.1